LGADGWDADMAAEDAALMRLAEQNGDVGVGGRLALGAALAAERFGAEAEPLAPGSLGDLAVRRNGAVRHVVVGGRVVVENGVLATADYESVTAQARAEATRLWSRMATI
jgi:cytosine/adenosine deaminase-related metal-dependent hydrolase